MSPSAPSIWTNVGSMSTIVASSGVTVIVSFFAAVTLSESVATMHGV